MLSVVIDSNVVVSSVFWGGASHKVMELASSGRIKGFTTECMTAELLKVLSHFRYRLPETKIAEILNLYGRAFETVTPDPVKVDIEDPEDVKFLACCAEAKADYLITGDEHLLKLRKFHGTKIVRPAEFLRLEGGSKRGSPVKRLLGRFPNLRPAQEIKDRLRRELYD